MAILVKYSHLTGVDGVSTFFWTGSGHYVQKCLILWTRFQFAKLPMLIIAQNVQKKVDMSTKCPLFAPPKVDI